MKQDINQLLLAHGAIQVSPDQVKQLNASPATIWFDDTVSNAPTNAGYQVVLSGYSQFVLGKEQKTNDYRSLRNELTKLRSMPRSARTKKLKGSVTTYTVSNEDYRIDYRIFNGQVEVFNIQPVDRLQKARDRLEKTAVYKIRKNGSGVWEIAKKLEAPKVETKYAAVNGQSNNLSKATWLMGKHLEVAYGNNVTEYTLFHNPSVGGIGDTWESIQDKFGFTTDVTRQFSNVLSSAQQNSGDTYWLAHSQGAVIFAEGVRYVLNGNSSWALNKLSLNGIRAKNKGSELDKQKVTFHGNANNNLRSSRLFDRAGIEVVGIRAHDYDFVANIIGANTLSPRKLLGSVVYSNHVFNGSVAQSPHTTSQTHESWDKKMKQGPGKGRGPIQKTFEFTVKTIKNFLP